jgi:DinB family protein
MNLAPPVTQEQILRAFEQQETESLAYWNGFDTNAFFQSIGSSWSPAETVRHLTKSTRPVATALGLPKFVLRIRFGLPRRPSLGYEELCASYRKALAEGGRAGRFGPSAQSRQDLDLWRKEIMDEHLRVLRDLRKTIERWPDAKLDRAQLPHPLLGNLTIREMLFFTLYHQRHHMDVVSRRMREAQSGTA